MRILLAALGGATAVALTYAFVSHNFFVCMIGPVLIGLLTPVGGARK